MKEITNIIAMNCQLRLHGFGQDITKGFEWMKKRK